MKNQWLSSDIKIYFNFKMTMDTLCEYFFTNDPLQPMSMHNYVVTCYPISSLLFHNTIRRYLTKVYVTKQKKIIGKQFDLSDYDDLLLVFKILPNLNTVNLNCRFGCIEMLELMYHDLDKFKSQYTFSSINIAIKNEQLDVIKWLYSKKNTLGFKYDPNAISLAVACGHSDIAEWFYKLELNY